jgi:hypothetical protein
MQIQPTFMLVTRIISYNKLYKKLYEETKYTCEAPYYENESYVDYRPQQGFWDNGLAKTLIKEQSSESLGTLS